MDFDPSKPFTVVGGEAAKGGASPPPQQAAEFDPNKPFSVVSQTHPEGAKATDAFNQQYGPRTTGEDIAYGAARGAVHSVGGLLGLPADISRLLRYIHTVVPIKIAEKTGAISPDQAAQLSKLVEPEGEPVLGSQWINNHVDTLMRGKPSEPPATTAGHYAESLGGFVPVAAGALLSGGVSAMPSAGRALASLGLNGVLPALTSETAGQVTKGTAAEPFARVAGAAGPGLLGAAVTRAINATRGALSSPLTTSLDGLTPAKADLAQEFLDYSRKVGDPLTLPEAIQYATGNATNVANLQRIVEQSPKGSKLREFFAARPEAVDAHGQKMLNQITAEGFNPNDIPERIRTAAGAAIADTPEAQALVESIARTGKIRTPEETGRIIQPELAAREKVLEDVRKEHAKLFDTAREADYTTNGAQANPIEIQPVISYVDDLLRSAKGDGAAALQSARKTFFYDGAPDTSVSGLMNARSAINSKINVAVRSGDDNSARLLKDVLGQLDSALEPVPAAGQARRRYAEDSRPLDVFAPGRPAGQIVERDQYNQRFLTPPEGVPDVLRKGGASGADDFLEAAQNSPEARQAAYDFHARDILGKSMDTSGNINPQTLAKAITDNADLLTRYPGIATSLQDVIGRRQALGAVQKTPLGALADISENTPTNQFTAQKGVVFNPTNPLPGGEAASGSASRAIGAIAEQDPAAAQAFVRMHLETAFNEAMSRQMAGPNQWAAPKFAINVVGNSQQEAELREIVRALPDGDLRWEAFRKGIDIFEAMGTRHPVGSQTDMNGQLRKWLQEGSFPVEAAAALLSHPLSFVQRLKSRVLYDRNSAKLADVFINGNVSDLQDMVNSARGSMKGDLALVHLLLEGAAVGGVASLMRPIDRERQTMQTMRLKRQTEMNAATPAIMQSKTVDEAIANTRAAVGQQ